MSSSPTEILKLPDYAPIPKASLGPALNSQGYYVGRVERNLYWVTDGVYQSMFLATGQGVIVVDAPQTIAPNLLKAISSVTSEPVTHFVYSHHHADHVGGAGVLPPGTTYIAQQETARLLARSADPNRPVPTVTFQDSYTLTLGSQTLVLDYKGVNHDPGNIFIYAPKQQTLMVVDVVMPGWIPFKGLAVSQDIPGWVHAQDVAMTYQWRTLVAGHLGRLGTRADVDLQRQYVSDLAASARATMASLDPTPFFQKYGPTGNSWAIFKAYLDAASQQAADPIVAKYTGKLAAADVFTFDNAYVLFESLRIDAGVLGPFGNHP